MIAFVRAWRRNRDRFANTILRLVIVVAALGLEVYFCRRIYTTQGDIAQAAALLGIGLAVALGWPFAVLMAIVFLMPLVSFAQFGGATINRYAVVCLLAGWGFQHLQSRRPFRFEKPVWIMLAWIGWGAISILWSSGRLWGQQVPSLLMAWILFAMVTDMVTTRRRLRWTVGALLAGMLVCVVVWLTTGRWIEETFFVPQFEATGFSHGNVIGPITVCVLVVILYARAPLRVAAIVCILPVGYLLLAAGLRRSFVTIAASLLALLALSRGSRLRTLALVVAALIAAYWAWDHLLPLLPEGIQYRYTIARTVETSMSGRFNIWSIALDIWAGSPIIGVGLGDFGVHTLLRPETYYRAINAHNMPLQVLAEQGVIGLALWSWGWARIVLSAVRAYRASRVDADRLLSAVPLSLVVLFLVGGLMDPVLRWRLVWLAWGLAVAGESIICSETAPDPVLDGRRKSSWPHAVSPSK